MAEKMTVTIDKKKNELVIRIPMEEPRLSSKGNSMIVASTGGFRETDAEVNGRPVRLNVVGMYYPKNK